MQRVRRAGWLTGSYIVGCPELRTDGDRRGRSRRLAWLWLCLLGPGSQDKSRAEGCVWV